MFRVPPFLASRVRSGGNPASVPGLRLWLDATRGLYTDAGVTAATSDGQAIQQWNDQSGNGNHASQATATARPTRSGSGTGLSFAYNSPTWQMMIAATGASMATTTMFAVARLDTLGSQCHLIDGDDPTDRNALYSTSANALSLFAGGSVAGNTLSAATRFRGSCVFNGASSWVKKDANARVTGNAGAAALSGVAVGADPTGNSGWIGVVNEILIYTGALSDANILTIENYLSTKWGTP